LAGAFEAVLRLPPTPTWLELQDAAKRWDEVSSGESVPAQLLQLALQLGMAPPSSTLPDLTGLVTAALQAALPEKALIMEGEVPGCLEAALLAQRSARFEELEARMGALEKRRDEGRELPGVEEWRELGGLIERYRTCAHGGLSDRGVAFAAIKDDLCNFGAWLFNVRDERPMAHAVFRFLATEAAALGDSGSEALNRSNMLCGI
jgi:hypothetical protein